MLARKMRMAAAGAASSGWRVTFSDFVTKGWVATDVGGCICTVTDAGILGCSDGSNVFAGAQRDLPDPVTIDYVKISFTYNKVGDAFNALNLQSGVTVILIKEIVEGPTSDFLEWDQNDGPMINPSDINFISGINGTFLTITEMIIGGPNASENPF